LRPAGSLDASNIDVSVPRLNGTTGSIELGIFDESERRRTNGGRARSQVRTARSSWPLSARLLVGASFVLNILLTAFLVTPLRPKAGSPPQLYAPPDQGSGLDQGSRRGLNAPPVETRPAALPSSQMAERPPIKALPKALRASKPSRAVLLAPMPRTVIYPLDEPLVRTPAPVRNPAASLSANANVASPRQAPSFSISGAGVPSSAGPHPNAPAASALHPSAIDHGLTAKGTQSGSVAIVASARLPAMEKGLVIPKTPVASVASQIQIVPRPAVKPPENCGDDGVFVACPTLKIRYDTPYTSEDHQ
jgi:hypothetical protein